MLIWGGVGLHIHISMFGTTSSFSNQIQINQFEKKSVGQNMNMLIYYTTLLKSVQITRKTSTNIQRYSDSWLFVYFRFEDSIF